MNAAVNLIDIVEQRGVVLRRAGRELVGRCPFHDDRSPSFSVNPDKQLWHCFGCQEGGDTFTFLMRHDRLTFPEAKRALGIVEDTRKPRPQLTEKRKRAARLAARWANEQRRKLNELIAVRYEQRDLADEIGDSELGETFDREIVVLREVYDSLGYPQGVLELLAVRESIERVTEEAR